MFYSSALTGLALVQLSSAAYRLSDDYNSGNFFDKFNFINAPDPTHGFVQYVDGQTAWNTGLVNNNNGQAYMGVDSSNVTPWGRPAVRLESKTRYDNGLFIIDVAHMPGGICGTWPAFWMFGPSWPLNGEIDILEGVNLESHNAMTLHTTPVCAVPTDSRSLSSFSGNLVTANCDVNAPGQASNAGCGIKDPSDKSFGQAANSVSGAIVATEVHPWGINIWRWERWQVPGDVWSGQPNPSGWGRPAAKFEGGCNVPERFRQMRLTFTNTFCGDWAGSVWGQSGCGHRAPTCNDFVRDNPWEFRENYWAINSIKVYNDDFNTWGTQSLSVSSEDEKVQDAETVQLPGNFTLPPSHPVEGLEGETTVLTKTTGEKAEKALEAEKQNPAQAVASAVPAVQEEAATVNASDPVSASAPSSENEGEQAAEEQKKDEEGRVLMTSDFPRLRHRHAMKHLRSARNSRF